MASFEDALHRFTMRLETRAKDVFVGSVNEARRSLVEGSEVTGAPGQPVDTGNLRASFQETFPEQWVGQVTTNVAYAPAIEDGQVVDHEVAAHTRKSVLGKMHQVRAHFRRGHVIRFLSPVGGAHSLKLTRAAWQRLVNHVAVGVKAAG